MAKIEDISSSRCSVTSKKSRKSIKSYSRRKRNKFHPYKAPSLKSIYKSQVSVSMFDFFNGITFNSEFGKDFLREMDTPICTSKIICLPLDVNQIAPGRCLVLSPLGHTCNMGFHCEHCSQNENPSFTNFQVTCANTKMGSLDSKELNSVTLTFHNHAHKVVQNKNFYLSLLSHSLNTVKQSFNQPSLLYSYTVLRTMCEDVFPIFVEMDKKLCMYTLFKNENLHIGEACLRLIIDNMLNYRVTLDCIKQTYVLKFEPIYPETNTMTVQEVEICEAVTSLDYTDEIKQEIVNGQELVAGF